MAKPDILQLGPLLPKAQAALDEQFTVHQLWQAGDREAFIAEVADRIRGVATAPGGRITAALIDALPKLEIIANFGVGYDSVDTARAAERGIVVTNTPDVLTEEVADTAMGLLIMTVRELSAAERYLRAGEWARRGAYPLTRGSLVGRSMGILGLGRIGHAIARRAVACGLRLAYCGRRRQADVSWPYYADLTAMARDVDILMVVAPGGPETHHLVNAEVLEALGPEGFLINIGRGSVVDEAALIAALRAGRILGAGLDVFEKEPQVPQALMELERVVLLPHVGSASITTREAMGRLVVDNLAAWFTTGKPLTPVPETPVPSARSGAGAP